MPDDPAAAVVMPATLTEEIVGPGAAVALMYSAGVVVMREAGQPGRQPDAVSAIERIVAACRARRIESSRDSRFTW